MTDAEHGWPHLPAPQTAVQPLQPRALYESLADRLRERILSHEFKPGQAMDEAVLLREYAISRTPVREALKLLQHEGLLTARPRRGMVVTVLGPDALWEAKRLYRLLREHARTGHSQQHGNGLLLQRMMEMAERHLRLGYGADFEQQLDAPRQQAPGPQAPS